MKDKNIVLITGANSGIGNALARKLISENYFVIATSRNGKIENLISENLFVIELDITNQNSINKLNEIIRSKFDSIKILINNAGIAPDLYKTELDINILRTTFETNVFGLVNLTETIQDFISKNGKIFNISSLMGTLNRESSEDSIAYKMSKTALNMYTKSLSAKLNIRKISVNSISPGWVITKMTNQNARLTPESSAEGIYKLIKRNIPNGTFWNAETQQKMDW